MTTNKQLQDQLKQIRPMLIAPASASMITDQMLVDKAVLLDESCMLIVSSKQQDWLFDLLYDDNGEPKLPKLNDNSRSFLTKIYEDFYTDTSGD